jgi:hypothetical protein
MLLVLLSYSLPHTTLIRDVGFGVRTADRHINVDDTCMGVAEFEIRHRSLTLRIADGTFFANDQTCTPTERL